MTNLKLLVEVSSFIAAYINGDRSGIKFNGDVLHTEGDHILYWNGKPIANQDGLVVSPYTLPPATTSTLGGVIVGDGLEVESNGTLSVLDFQVLEFDLTPQVNGVTQIFTIV